MACNPARVHLDLRYKEQRCFRDCSGTTTICVHSFRDDTGQMIYLVDAHGLNNTLRADVELVKEMAYFFKANTQLA